jgi:NADPH:quinone reductase-like Zn-dependent oxidoreductase
MTTNETMQAVTQHELGGPEVLGMETVPLPQPSIGQIRVRVHAAGVNPADRMNRHSGAFTKGLPFTLGWDVSGVVDAVGPGVTLFAPGDEVFGLLPFPGGAGAYAQYAVGPTRAFVRKPAAIDHIQAAALPLAGLTAWQALVDTAQIRPESRVVVTAAAGGVGHLAVQIAHARGAEVIAFTSAANAGLLRELGADIVIDDREVDVTHEVHDVDVVLEMLGGDSLTRALTLLAPGGVLVSTLPQSLAPAAADAAARGIRLAGLFVEADQIGLLGLSEAVARGELRPVIAATYPLAEAAAAHAARHGAGKVVLAVG